MIPSPIPISLQNVQFCEKLALLSKKNNTLKLRRQKEKLIFNGKNSSFLSKKLNKNGNDSRE